MMETSLSQMLYDAALEIAETNEEFRDCNYEEFKRVMWNDDDIPSWGDRQDLECAMLDAFHIFQVYGWR